MSVTIVKTSNEAIAAVARTAERAESATPRGLPAPLPEGEIILWQGQPAWRSLARRAMHLRGMSLYFGALAVWTFGDALYSGAGIPDALLGATWLLVIGAVAIGLLSGYAWLSARASIYTITNRRVVLSFGVALPMSVNVPYALIESAALKLWPNGTGDIPLSIVSERRLSYVLFWPNVRPWRFTRPEPMMRAVPQAEAVAAILAAQLAAAHGDAAAAEPAVRAAPRASEGRGDERGAPGFEPATA